tara:strand:- start:907 stop:1155 length:249 start_codon:yes stop_codon:yes gene_type:complete
MERLDSLWDVAVIMVRELLNLVLLIGEEVLLLLTTKEMQQQDMEMEEVVLEDLNILGLMDTKVGVVDPMGYVEYTIQSPNNK